MTTDLPNNDLSFSFKIYSLNYFHGFGRQEYFVVYHVINQQQTNPEIKLVMMMMMCCFVMTDYTGDICLEPGPTDQGLVQCPMLSSHHFSTVSYSGNLQTQKKVSI